MTNAIETNVAEWIADDEAPATPLESPDARAEVKVLFTREDETRAALKSAVELSGMVHVGVSLVILQVVPRPLPPDCPPVPLDFLVERAQKLATPVAESIELKVYYCRSMLEVLPRVFGRGDTIVIGRRHGWLGRKETRLGKSLQRLGCTVMYVEK